MGIFEAPYGSETVQKLTPAEAKIFVSHGGTFCFMQWNILFRTEKHSVSYR